MATNIAYYKTLLTGGATNALDGINGTSLSDNDLAFALVSDALYVYRLNATSGAAENPPDVIAPDNNAGTKRWILQGVYGYAKSGANADITSMTGLDGDGIASPETSLADDAGITLDTGKTGRGWAMAGDNEEYIEFRFTAAGVVTVISNSANAINTDTDGCLCVYDVGTGIAIKNRLGATKNIRYIVNYS